MLKFLIIAVLFSNANGDFLAQADANSCKVELNVKIGEIETLENDKKSLKSRYDSLAEICTNDDELKLCEENLNAVNLELNVMSANLSNCEKSLDLSVGCDDKVEACAAAKKESDAEVILYTKLALKCQTELKANKNVIDECTSLETEKESIVSQLSVANGKVAECNVKLVAAKNDLKIARKSRGTDLRLGSCEEAKQLDMQGEIVYFYLLN